MVLFLGNQNITKQHSVAARDVVLSLESQSVTKQHKVAASNDLVIVVAVQLVHPPRQTCVICCDTYAYLRLHYLLAVISVAVSLSSITSRDGKRWQWHGKNDRACCVAKHVLLRWFAITVAL